jgi:hypothetical protein
MQNSIPIISVFSTLVVVILCSACVSQSPNPVTTSNTGFTQVTDALDSSRISFTETRQNFREFGNSLLGSGNATTVHYILARDVDETGNATSWIFGAKQGTEAGLLVFDRSGWTLIPWNETRSLEVVDLDHISPDTLFYQNKALILGNTSPSVSERRDLELKNGIYTVTIVSGSPSRSITFNATTGALIT